MTDPVLSIIERCYDDIPRRQGTTEEVGPFTLFLAAPGTGHDFYARPAIDTDDITAEITADDVRRVLARQRELGVARAIEWVDEVTPALLPAARAVLDGVGGVGGHAGLQVLPLLALPPSAVLPPPDPRVTLQTGEEPDFALVLGAIHGGFGETDEVEAREAGGRAALIADGSLIVVGAHLDGVAVGGGSAVPRAGAAELLGIATVPSARRQGLAAGVVGALARACREAGVSTVYLGAASDASAGVYRSVGFERVGTACILNLE